MNQTSDMLLLRRADGTVIVSLPEKALAEGLFDDTRERLLALADQMTAGELRLDFAQIQCLGSCALGLLVTVHRRTQTAGGHLVLDHLAPHLTELFQLTRLDTILDVRTTPSNA